MLSDRRLERIVKGFANHRRIQIMRLLSKQPELSVMEIAHQLRVELPTASEHIRKMALGGLLFKRSQGLWVRHRLSERGEAALAFCSRLH